MQCLNLLIFFGEKDEARENTVGLLYLRALHPQGQLTSNQKYLRKKIPESSKKQNVTLLCTGNYLHSINTLFTIIYIYIYNYLHIHIQLYIVLGITGNLEMIQSIREHVCRLYANTKPFYIRDLSICRFWYPRGVLGPISRGYQGVTALWIKWVSLLNFLRKF